MTIHQQQLLVEIAEARRNPVLAYLDDKLSKFTANRLERRHGERLIRQILRALSELENFPPANLVWNAGHRDVPLHCFFRIRREPVFRILRIERTCPYVKIVIEHGKAAKRHTTRQTLFLEQTRYGDLKVCGVDKT